MFFQEPIIIWNWLNGSLVYKLKGHDSTVYSLDLYDDQTLISGAFDATIKLWNISNGELSQSIDVDIGISALVMLERGKKEIFQAFAFLTFLLEKCLNSFSHFSFFLLITLKNCWVTQK